MPTTRTSVPTTFTVVDGDRITVTGADHGRAQVLVGRSLLNGRSWIEVQDLVREHLDGQA